MTPVREGQIIYEVSNVSSFEGLKALTRASFKCHLKLKLLN